MTGGFRGFCLVAIGIFLMGIGCSNARMAESPPRNIASRSLDEVRSVDPLRGEVLFHQPVIGPQRVAGCITCHSLTPDTVLVGPSLADVGRTAVENPVRLSAAEFLKQSIVQPDQTITSGFDSGVMIQSYGEDLTSQEIADLVAFLLTLRTD